MQYRLEMLLELEGFLDREGNSMSLIKMLVVTYQNDSVAAREDAYIHDIFASIFSCNLLFCENGNTLGRLNKMQIST